MRTCLTNGTYRVALCLYSGRAKPFSSFSWGGLVLGLGGGLDIEHRVCEFVGEPGAVLPRKIFKPGGSP